MMHHIRNSLRTIRQNPAGRARPIRSLCRYGRWQWRTRVRGAEPVARYLDRFTLRVERDSGSGLTGYLDLPEYDEMAFFLLVLDEHARLIDVGANIGWYAVLGAGARGAAVEAFEPVPETFRLLQANLERNGLSDRVKAHGCGLSDEEGTLQFTVPGSCLARPVAEGETGDAVQEIPVKRLDTVVAPTSQATWLKIDTEGFEFHVLRGATALLADPQTRGLVVETRQHGVRYGSSEAAMIDWLAAFGFEALRFDAPRRALLPVDRDGLPGDTWFVREVQELERLLAERPPVQVGTHRL